MIYRYSVNIEANYVEGDDQIYYADVTVIAFSEDQARDVARKEIMKFSEYKRNGIRVVRVNSKKEAFPIPQVVNIRHNPED